MAVVQALVLVPAINALSRRSKEFDESHATLDHAAGQQALASELFCFGITESVHLSRGVGFRFQIEKARYLGLHPEGQFVVADRGLYVRDAAEAVQHALVQLP